MNVSQILRHLLKYAIKYKRLGVLILYNTHCCSKTREVSPPTPRSLPRLQGGPYNSGILQMQALELLSGGSWDRSLKCTNSELHLLDPLPLSDSQSFLKRLRVSLLHPHLLHPHLLNYFSLLQFILMAQWLRGWRHVNMLNTSTQTQRQDCASARTVLGVTSSVPNQNLSTKYLQR